MLSDKKHIIIRACIICVLLILAVTIGFMMIRYETEGEKEMPYKLSKMMIISTADGIAKEDNKIAISQCNDFYLSFEKNENYTGDSMIKNIYIYNIKVLSNPVKGEVKFYKPASDGTLVYDSNENNLIEDELVYSGDIQTSLKALTIANQGGTISFRSCVQNIGEIEQEQNESKTISYNNDGTLLQKAEISIEDIHYNMGFDILIELTDGKMYKGHVNETLPIEDTEKGGVQGVEKINLDNVVFKRTKIK